jgi:hypothetical protein
MEKIGIMQPYLFPYLGYFQLVGSVDLFVLSDDLQYINKGWINRNRVLINGEARYIGFPLKKASHLAKINERRFADDFPYHMEKMLKSIEHAYGRAQHFEDVYPLIEEIITFRETNLAKYAEHSIRRICRYLGIATAILISSELQVSRDLDGQYRVIETVKRLSGDTYINPIGGVELYDYAHFRRNGITLKFHRMNDIRYRQFGRGFVPGLSIIDVLMFNSIPSVTSLLSSYTLEEPGACPITYARCFAKSGSASP